MSIRIITGNKTTILFKYQPFQLKEIILGRFATVDILKNTEIFTVPRKAKVFDSALVFPILIVQVWTVKLTGKKGGIEIMYCIF